jgi:hypothetical protein
MSPLSNLPTERAVIPAGRFHPSTFTEFTAEEVEQSIPRRFEKIVARPERIASSAAAARAASTALERRLYRPPNGHRKKDCSHLA